MERKQGGGWYNVIALLCLVVGLVAVVAGIWQIGLPVMFFGLVISIVGWIKFKQRRKQSQLG